MNNEAPTAAVTVRDVQLPATVPETGPLSASDVLRQLALVQEVMHHCMKDGEHYGRIPGCGDKPTLLKAGAEKLCLTFRLAPTYEVQQDNHEHGHREYRIQCSLKSVNTGAFLGEGVGICSTMEAKYRFRSGSTEATDRPVPRVYWDLRQEDPAKAQELLGGKGFSPKKVGGQGWMIAKGGEKVENDNPADVYNTVLKMAKKRALVDAVLTATAASDMFTQDLEDISANTAVLDARNVTPAPVAALPPQAAPRQQPSRPASTPTPAQQPKRQSAPVEAEVIEVDPRAAAGVLCVPFGKNQGVPWSKLSEAQRRWYLDDWSGGAKKRPLSLADRDFLTALDEMVSGSRDGVTGEPIPADTVIEADDSDTPPWDVEGDTQERPTTWQTVQAKMAEAGIQEEDLAAVCRKQMRGEGDHRKPMLEPGKPLSSLDDAVLITILTGWSRYANLVKTERSIKRSTNGVKPMSEMQPAA